MKNLCSPEILKFRDGDMDALRGTPDELRAYGGAFVIPYRRHRGGTRGFSSEKPSVLRVIASRGGGSSDIGGDDPYSRWDHVSVSLPDRCPTWEEMCFIKELFFSRDEPAMQLHPAKDYVNNHPYCLHLWRPLDAEIPLPFPEMVGIPGLEFAA